MKFRFTLAVPNFSGNRPVHQITAEHPANSLAELAEAIRRDDVLVVDEFFTYNFEDKPSQREERGSLIINWAHCAKVDEYRESRKDRPAIAKVVVGGR